MKRNSGILGIAAALLTTLFLAAVSPAQTDIPAFTGRFTLANQVQWDETMLPPGTYTIAIESHGATFALLRDGEGRPVARFPCASDAGNRSARNMLLMREKGGQMRVYALALASLGRVLVYDRDLAREAIREARASQGVPVVLAKR